MAPRTYTGKRRTAVVAVRYAVGHHAKEIAPLKQALQDALDWSGILHRIDSSRGGNNSNVLILEDGRRFYLRGRMHSYPPQPHISIRKRGSSKEIKLLNERDVIRFVESL